MNVITLAGSPRFPSRSSALLTFSQRWLEEKGINVIPWNLFNFNPEDLLYAKFDSPGLKVFIDQLAAADGVIISTPVYKASFTGALKTLLDLLPERAFENKVILPLASGGSSNHMLALDYALKPVLNALKAQEILHGVFAEDSQITHYDHTPLLSASLEARLTASLSDFSHALERKAHFSAPSFSQTA
ncbi:MULTISPECIES: NADPH-dependent FMN reductase [Brenneria]|uniref:NADPH-dependent FMN reductase n=1 Tax=Brenneria nigrifluens DSM 30175 = ATCC 13028 TaxID=1121120 RepID=A0A2U1US95_9GAMM|nr:MULTISPECIES: NADPH-dependent FMN reductase [Brenneria]EHD21116.1 FMN reductase [Brenneria sp. EniD312]PWC24536.1 NADPH-dependent FMN reductase [Brenneria nigrifluens DSM 30175 = ATCC 13028]QCR04267.1 NADPH-dependent FMN reductase [Brenneria nigrifluens DSM 30175 = ATCC 13028]